MSGFSLSEIFDKMFDGYDLQNCVDMIEKQSWCWEYKWELMKKLVRISGTELFNLETEIGLAESSNNTDKERDSGGEK